MSLSLLGCDDFAKLSLPKPAVVEAGFHMYVLQNDLVQAQFGRAVLRSGGQNGRDIPRTVRGLCDLEVATCPGQGGQFWLSVPQRPNVHLNPYACGGKQGVRGSGKGERSLPQVHTDVGKPVPPGKVDVVDNKLPLDPVVEQGHSLLFPSVAIHLSQRGCCASEPCGQSHHAPHDSNHFGWGGGGHESTKVRRREMGLNTSGIQVFT